MKEERWKLALDISTKGGLDVMGVWSAWGMTCLKMGHYSNARKKFSYCLQVLFFLIIIVYGFNHCNMFSNRHCFFFQN